jgi:hypothetical protein
MYSVFLARNMLEGCHLHEVTQAYSVEKTL